MRTHLSTLVPLAFLVSSGFFALEGCSAAPTESAESDDGQLTQSWFDANLPKGSPEEKAVLALVNDRSMSADEYVDTCDFSLSSSASIVDYRQGDEPADTSDDEVFDNVAELDRLPFTDRPFWAAAIACAKAHYLPTTGGTCATGSSTVQQSPLAIEVVLDGSASMTTVGKWPAATGAVQELFTAQAAKKDPKVGMGLIGFSDSKDPSSFANPVYPTAVDVPIASMDAAQLARLDDRLQGAQPSGGTPLYEAVTGAYGYLGTFAPTNALASATKVVVVVTDGMPNDHGPELLTFVQSHAADAQLFAVGIGEVGANHYDYDPAYMGQLAVAGGTRTSATCSPTEVSDESKMCHLQVTPSTKTSAQIKDELLTAFDKIRTDVAACDIGLQTLGTGTLDASNVTVTMKLPDGTETAIRKHKTYGWSFDDAKAPTKVLLRGKACNSLRGTPGAVARVSIACK